MAIGLLLVALGVGYAVFILASKEKESVKFLGQGIGVLIMVAAVLSILCTSMASCLQKSGCDKMKNCPLSGKKQCTIPSYGGAE